MSSTTYRRQAVDSQARQLTTRFNAAELARTWAKHIELKHGGVVAVKRCDANTYVTLNNSDRTVRKQVRDPHHGWVDARTFSHAEIRAVLKRAGL